MLKAAIVALVLLVTGTTCQYGPPPRDNCIQAYSVCLQDFVLPNGGCCQDLVCVAKEQKTPPTWSGLSWCVPRGQGPWNPTQGPWYPTQGPWYPTQGPWYPTQGPWDPDQEPWYPTQGPWYPTQGPWAPWPTSTRERLRATNKENK